MWGGQRGRGVPWLGLSWGHPSPGKHESCVSTSTSYAKTQTGHPPHLETRQLANTQTVPDPTGTPSSPELVLGTGEGTMDPPQLPPQTYPPCLQQTGSHTRPHPRAGRRPVLTLRNRGLNSSIRSKGAWLGPTFLSPQARTRAMSAAGGRGPCRLCCRVCSPVGCGFPAV